MRLLEQIMVVNFKYSSGLQLLAGVTHQITQLCVLSSTYCKLIINGVRSCNKPNIRVKQHELNQHLATKRS